MKRVGLAASLPPRSARRELQNLNDEQLTFSHSHGYEELPKQLKLEDLPLDARRRIWNVFYVFLERSKRDDTMIGGRASLGAPWKGVFRNGSRFAPQFAA